MNHPIYYTAEPSATSRGLVGLVVDAETHRAILRTPLTYTGSSEAIQAARNLWLSRPRAIRNAQQVA